MAKVQDIRNRTPRKNGTRSLSQVTTIVRHHSATTSGNFDSFWRHWNGTNGWGTGGYHEIIWRDGTVELCYDATVITNGVGGHNTNTYHICMVGNGSFTEAQEKAWDERVAVNMKRFNIKVNSVKGHGEMPGASTSCPGIDMNIVRARITNGTVGGVEVEAPSKPIQKPSSNSGGGSIVNWMDSKKMDSSYENRARLAKQHGISNYKGTAEQNIALLDKLKAVESKPTPKPSTPKPAVPKGDQKTASIVTYLNSVGVNSSYSNRAKLAAQHGISGYKGTAAQNTRLLNILRGGGSTSAPAKPKARKGEGIVDYMNRTGQDSSYANRARLASQHGIKNYKGTAAQNSQLLSKISG